MTSFSNITVNNIFIPTPANSISRVSNNIQVLSNGITLSLNSNITIPTNYTTSSVTVGNISIGTFDYGGGNLSGGRLILKDTGNFNNPMIASSMLANSGISNIGSSLHFMSNASSIANITTSNIVLSQPFRYSPSNTFASFYGNISLRRSNGAALSGTATGLIGYIAFSPSTGNSNLPLTISQANGRIYIGANGLYHVQCTYHTPNGGTKELFISKNKAADQDLNGIDGNRLAVGSGTFTTISISGTTYLTNTSYLCCGMWMTSGDNTPAFKVVNEPRHRLQITLIQQMP